ncbi:protein SSUH2 homolog [Centruroides vittatus]|uniref:protein SSUH2 homolog n=1 Tax=Centruroides vittatus TaxID=120091 RepID=UPI00350F33E3
MSENTGNPYYGGGFSYPHSPQTNNQFQNSGNVYPSGTPNQPYPSNNPNQPYPSNNPNQPYPSNNPNQPYPSNNPNQPYPSETVNNSENFQPSAPPLDKIEKVPGYEGVTFATTTLPPPIYPDLPSVPPERQEIQKGAGLSVEEVREAAIDYVSQHCCYGKDTVENMAITNISMSSAFHYKLETFAEKRETKWAFDPYNGEILDTPMNGIAPGPWDIPLAPTREFSDSVQTMEVPHTASAMSCHVCVGACRERCPKCHGGCMELCTWCNGDGKRFDDTCNHCNGSGRHRCNKCNGTGLVKCRTCSGKGSLKCYVKLTATWKNHVDDFIVEQTSLPDQLIRDVTGHVAFEEQQLRVWPINHFQPSINDASNQLVQKHNQAFQMERILQQRHKVRIVPVAEVKYNWKDRSGQFFVYGFENKVYFPDYPQSCCWGCSIL